MTNTRRYLAKAVVLAALLVGVDYISGNVLHWMYFNQKDEDYFYTTKALDVQTCDLVVLGSSRARNHYDADILADSLGISCYNAGRSGCFLVYQSCQLDMILDRYVPRHIVLEVTPYDMMPGEGDYDRLSSLLPYSNHASFWAVIHKKSKWEEFKCLSKVYPYNSMVLKMVKNLKDNGEFRQNGFHPLHGRVNDPIKPYESGSDDVDERKIAEMKHIIETCRQHGIGLTMVTSPMYADTKPTRTLAITDSLCHAYEVNYISYLNDKDYARGDLFHSVDHLNEEGAKMFSSDIAHKLKQIVQSQ